MATYTASTFAALPRAVHAGVNHLSIFYDHTTNSTSANEVILLAKLPNGARVLDWAETHSVAGTAALDIGWASGANSGGGADLSALASGVAANTANRLGGVKTCPAVVSVSNNDANKYGILAAKIGTVASSTAGMTIRMMLTYEVTGGTQ